MGIKDLDVIWNKIDTPKPGDNGCWNWIKSVTSAGYGQLKINGVYWTAHRYVAWAMLGLDPQSDLIVRHKCHNPRCCNPNHLRLGDHKQNFQDSIDKYRMTWASISKDWIINGVTYKNSRAAVLATGIASATIMKHTNRETRIFDLDAYRANCVIAKTIPKI